MSTLIYVLVGGLIVVDSLVMFLSSNYDTPEDMPAPWRPFFQFSSLAQQLHILGSPFGRPVESVPVFMSTSLSRSSHGR